MAEEETRTKQSPATLKSSTAEASSDSGESFLNTALNIIGRETGSAMVDLSNHTTFDELGVDSLMAAQFCDGFKKQLNLDVVPSLFGVECEDIGGLKEWLMEKRAAIRKRMMK